MEVSKDPLFRKLRKSAPLETRFFAACENGPFKKFSFSQPAKASRDTRHGFAICESFTRGAPRFRNLRKLHARRATVSQSAKAPRETVIKGKREIPALTPDLPPLPLLYYNVSCLNCSMKASMRCSSFGMSMLWGQWELHCSHPMQWLACRSLGTLRS